MSELKIEIENSRELLFECYICQLKFDQYALEVHFVTAHSNFQNENIKKCDICDKSFKSQIILKKHIKNIHKGCKDHKCDSCGKSFTQAGNLRTHIKKFH